MSQHGDPIDIVERFVACFNENRISDALSYLSDDVYYHNVPMEPMTGRAAVQSFMAAFDLGGAIRTKWEILAIAARDDVVLTERIDSFFRSDGRGGGIPMMGSFRIRDGLIAEWRDYFDLAEFQRVAAILTEASPQAEDSGV